MERHGIRDRMTDIKPRRVDEMQRQVIHPRAVQFHRNIGLQSGGGNADVFDTLAAPLRPLSWQPRGSAILLFSGKVYKLLVTAVDELNFLAIVRL